MRALKRSILSPIQPLLKQATDAWLRFSMREKALIGGCVLVIIPFCIYEYAILPVREAFSEQEKRIAKLTDEYKSVPFILDRYTRLKQKRDQLETEFKEVEIKEGEQSLLENILSGKVDVGFDIVAGGTHAFGGSYEQANFTVRFTTSSLSSVVSVLKEVSTGSKRLIITTLLLSRDPNADKIKVEVGVSSIRQRGATSA